MTSPKPPRNLFPKIALLVGSTLISLLILEFFLRIVSPPTLFTPLLPLRPHHKMKLHVALKGVSPVVMHTTNRWGFRGEEPPSEWEKVYTIVAIGGSTTQCFYLDDSKTWPYRLQEELRKEAPDTWVGNGGLDGQSTRAHLIFMKEVIPRVKPDAVIFLIGGNDFGFSISDDRIARGLVYDRTSWKYKIYATSRLLQILCTWKSILLDEVTVVRKGGHGNYNAKPLAEKEIPLPKDLKTMLPFLEEYRANVKELIWLGKTMGVRVIFMSQPILFENNSYWRGIEGYFYWIKRTKGILSAATYWRLLNIYNEALEDICRSEKVEYFDLASAISHENDTFYDALHLNEKGADRVARKVAQFLKGSIPHQGSLQESEGE